MKKILLFICMVMCVVGAKAEASSYSASSKYDYSTDNASFFLRNYSILGNVSGKSISSMEIESISQDGEDQTLHETYNSSNKSSSSTSDDWRFVRIGSDATNYPLWIYYHDTRSSTYGSNASSDNATSQSGSDGYYYGFSIDYKRNIAHTYVIKGKIGLSTGGTVSFTFTLNPNYTTTNSLSSSDKTIDWVSSYSLSNCVSGGTSATKTYTCTNAKTYSGGEIADYAISSSTLSNIQPGIYTISCTQSPIWNSTTQAAGATKSFTLTVKRKTPTWSYEEPTYNNVKGAGTVLDITGCVTSVSDGATHYTTYSALDGASLSSNGKLTVNMPGKYQIRYIQDQSDTYTGFEQSFYVTVSANKLHKVHSCMINDYQMSAWYDGGDANTWVNNTPNLRYVNPNTLLNSELYIRGGVEAEDGNHTVIKFSDNPSKVITSTRLLLNNSNQIVSTNPTFNDTDKYDYVVPGNADNVAFTFKAFENSSAKGTSPRKETSYTDAQKVTYTRTEGIPEIGHYATICLPFNVPVANMPEGYTFEKRTGTPDKTTGEWRMAFTTVSSLEAGKPYIFTRDNTSSATLSITVPAASATFVAQPVTTDDFFYGTFINLIEADLHAETKNPTIVGNYNPYNNGYTEVSQSELDDYFASLYDASNKRVAFFLKNADSRDEIRRAGTNVSMRPLRAFFRFNPGDFGLSSWSDAQNSGAKLTIVHLGFNDTDGVSNITANGNSEYVDVFTIFGAMVAKHRLVDNALDGLQKGAYILSNGKKVVK